MIDQTVLDGTRMFLRLTALTALPMHSKWIRDENDLIDGIKTVRDSFLSTRRVIGQQLYQNDTVFEPCEDVKKALEEWLLAGEDQKEVALQRKRNLAMYHLVIEPVIDQFKDQDHRFIMATVNGRLSELINYIENNDITSHIDDALVTKVQVSKLIAEREQARKLVKAKRRPRRKMSPREEIKVVQQLTEDIALVDELDPQTLLEIE